ncbi:MAG: glycoside hydrolase family 15 protein [Deltaproteobacteria bacterium]|nr:glycoside hydrolase family 15 protein [Deltaproteobacteria bacterium]
MAGSIGNYGVIGDCRSAALVSKEGSIDWLCWPRFDSPSLFGALLDPQAGHFRLQPRGLHGPRRRYVEASNVLETSWTGSSGALCVMDAMTATTDAERRRSLLPDHEILRVATCTKGEVEVVIELATRPNYGRELPRVRRWGPLGVRIETRQGLLVLRTDLPRGSLEIDDPGTVRGRARLRAGDSALVSLTFCDDWPAVLPPLGQATFESIRRTERIWSDWASRITYDGPRREAVVRSALALRLMVYAPSGAIVAAPTTSLPERLGGDLNWDYRYCWLRDAALTVRALFGVGFHEEAESFVSWLLHATRLTRPRLQVLYDVHGRQPTQELELTHLAGHRDSKPVRVGNAASDQLQLDVYGEVIDAVAQSVRRGGRIDHDVQRFLCDLGKYVCRHWMLADEGIWEPRSGRHHRTHSRVLCWTALDRLIELAALGQLRRAPLDDFRKHRDRIARDVHENGYCPRLASYVATYGAADVDASLLLLPWYGFEDARAERMRSTYNRIRLRLGARDGLLHRYRSSDSAGEGAFGICSFWGAEYLALGGGSAAQARAAFEALLRFGNDLGLYAEEIDVGTGEPLGNFPQAFTHVGLMNAAISLQRRLAQEHSHEARASAARTVS